MQTIKQTIITLIICLTVVAGVSLVSAWTGPTSSPPNGNTPAPINISGTEQIKSGPLQVNGFRNIGTSIFDGNVGIGTTDPKAKLDITDSQRWHWIGEPSNYYLHLNASLNGDSDVSWNFVQKNYPTEYNVLTFRKGNVGIGTTGPDAKLDVRGRIYARLEGTTGGNPILAFTHNTDPTLFTDPTNDAHEPPVSSYTGIVARTGEVLINNTWTGYDFTGAYSASGFVGARIAAQFPNLAADNIDTNLLFLARGLDGFRERMRISSSGNVGIGTTAPGSKLQVNGKIQAIGGDICTDQGGGKCLSAAGGVAGYEIKTQTCGSSCTVYCTSGKEILGGGCSPLYGSVGRLIEVRPQGNNGWYCWGDNSNHTVYAICADMQ